MPTVSVVIPAFNAAVTLDEALESVVHQSFEDWEAMVVDDGSSDETAGRARSWADRDRRIRVLRHPDGANHGRGATRNLGIAESEGAIVAFLDADDRLDLEALATFFESFDRFPTAGVIYGRSRVLRDRPTSELVGRGEAGCPRRMFRQLTRFNVLATSATAARREALGRAPFPEDMPLAQDWACWVLLSRRWPFVYVDKVISTVRMHGASGTATMLLSHGERDYELAQARFLQGFVRSLQPRDVALVEGGLVFRATAAAQRASSLLLRGHLSAAARWFATSARVAGSSRIFAAALLRVWPEQVRVWRRADPPLLTDPE
jgi:cellulose synthase/poly-beta-1,6-N-acetylglucosamine synthase-like glycosyltransferase